MKRWKKITLLLLVLLVLSQLPFIYRRHRLALLREEIARLNSERKVDPNSLPLADYKGVIHVHSILGGHSTGGFSDIIRAARANALDFVIMTEHPSAELDTAAMTLHDRHAGVLFVGGSEISAAGGDRLLLMPGDGWANSAGTSNAQEIISQAKARRALAFVAYPHEFKSWGVSGYDGIEVYNLYTDARRASAMTLFFDGLWSYGSYPDLLFTRFYERPTESLRRWDELLTADRSQRLVAVAGNDAHANVGFGLADGTGRQLAGFQLDPYERSFRIVRNHVLVEKSVPLNADTLLAALSAGHSYLAFDLFCEATGFSYTAQSRDETKLMGDEIKLAEGLRLSVRTPVGCRIRLIKDGALVREEAASDAMDFPVTEAGVYRVEAFLDQLPVPLQDRPWIISNPIYVR